MKNDLTGLKFGKITVINYNGIKEYKCGTKDNLWKCRCECGNEVILYQICPIHGEFWQTPYNHINRKHGCSICSRKNRHHIN